jgi:hypothetical protein
MELGGYSLAVLRTAHATNGQGSHMPDEEPAIMETYQHEDGHDIIQGEKGSTAPDGSPVADSIKKNSLGLPGSVDGPTPTKAGEWAEGEGASGPVTETGAPTESGAVLSPGTSSDTDGGQQ